ncbi:MAG: uracil-DNA glycosylase family protein [Polyangiales bacterium]
MESSSRKLHETIASCDICRKHLPLGPRPVVQFSRKSRIAIVGQAPGSRVHESGIPWDDPSGEHLREWLGVSTESFYDPDSFALVPMGFCYPGKGKSGDAPPRPECAPQWHQRVFDAIARDPLVLLVGQYAHRHYLGALRKKTLTETVRAFDEYSNRTMPLPHPSWRSRIWMKNNPWFEARLLPVLRRRVKKHLTS